MSQCDAPGSAERDPDDGFVERPWRAAAAFVRRSGLPAGDGPCRTAAERVRHSRMTPVPQPSVTLVTEALTLTGIDPFVPGSMLLTYPRSKTRDANAGSPRSNRILVLPMVGSGCLIEFPPRREQGLEGTRSLLSSRLQREHEGADPIPARPSACRWLGHRESSFVAGGSDRSPESDRPLPAVPRSSVFRSLLHATAQCVAECGFQIGDEVTQHLSSSLMAPVGCGDTLRTASSPCSTEGLLLRAIPRRTARTASPRCPPSSRRASMRARPARDRTLLRGAGGAEPVRTRARLPGMPFRPRRPPAQHGKTTPKLGGERASALHPTAAFP
jgi:hypothetical protein